MYDIIYEKFTDAEKKTFLGTFIESVEIFPQPQENGQILKCINFKFSVFYDGVRLGISVGTVKQQSKRLFSWLEKHLMHSKI